MTICAGSQYYHYEINDTTLVGTFLVPVGHLAISRNNNEKNNDVQQKQNPS